MSRFATAQSGHKIRNKHLWAVKTCRFQPQRLSFRLDDQRLQLKEKSSHLEGMVKPLREVSMAELWRGELEVELAQFKAVQKQLTEVVAKLDALGAANQHVRLLQTASGVGPRLAEAVVTMFDDPRRFRRGSAVSAYIGMVPKQWDSGETERLGKITRHGNRLVRSLLVEVAWCALRHNPWARETYQRISGGKKSRKKIAIVAVGRKLLVRCWAMLRDQTAWRVSEPQTVATGSGGTLETQGDFSIRSTPRGSDTMLTVGLRQHNYQTLRPVWHRLCSLKILCYADPESARK